MVIFLGKYSKLAILASLVEPKSLSELGIFWYNENGRFYKKNIREEINQAIHKTFLMRDRAKLKANTEKLITATYSNIKDKKLKEMVCRFWCHQFSQQTFLCCKAIKTMFNNSPKKAAEANLSLILHTPIILHQLQEKDPELYSFYVSSQMLDKYVNIININAEKNMPIAFKNLKEKTDWITNLNNIVKNNGHFLKHTSGMLRIKHLLKNKK